MRRGVHTAIVDVQAWREEEIRPWSEEYENGHYMVLIGQDEENLYFEDPSLLGSQGLIPIAEFVDGWHDYEGNAPFDAADREFVHMAIFIRGDEPAPPAPLEPVK